MRFESKDFMKSQRQWSESRGFATEGRNAIKRDGDGSGRTRYRNSVETGKDCNGSSRYLNEKRYIEDDARDDDTIEKIEQAAAGDDSMIVAKQTRSGTSDFSKKELLQLARRRKQRQKKDQMGNGDTEETTKTKTTTTTTTTTPTATTAAAANSNSYEDFVDILRMGSVDSFIDAHNKVKKSNRAQGIPNSRGMDGLLLAMLPSDVWISDILNESRHAIDKIQTRIFLNYSNDQ